jgi:hypothetical protein
MELRIAVADGLLDRKTHRIMKMMATYVSTKYGIKPDGMDLEGAVFSIDEDMCQEVVNDIKRRFERHLKYIEVECF